MSAAERSWRVGDLAARFALEVRGDPELQIRGVSTLALAGPEHLSFLSNPHYRSQMQSSRAGAIVLRADDAPLREGTALEEHADDGLCGDEKRDGSRQRQQQGKLHAAILAVHGRGVIAGAEMA